MLIEFLVYNNNKLYFAYTDKQALHFDMFDNPKRVGVCSSAGMFLKFEELYTIFVTIDYIQILCSKGLSQNALQAILVLAHGYFGDRLSARTNSTVA